MSKVSRLYRSVDNIYHTNTSHSSSKTKNGDIKHIFFKDGKPVMTEIIRVGSDTEVSKEGRAKPKRRSTRPAQCRKRSRRSSQEVLLKKRNKLAERLKKAVQSSETLWSEKKGILISYQGNPGFLVKLFSSANRPISEKFMTKEEVLESSIPGILDTGWQKL